MKFLPLVWSALIRRKLRTILTTLSVAVAFALFGTMMGLDASFRHLSDLASKDAAQVFARFGDYVTDGMGAQIARLPGVAGVTPYGMVFGYHQNPKNNVFVVMADPAASKVWYGLQLKPAEWSLLAKEPNGVL